MTMRWSVLLVCGCNQVLGLTPTRTDDARPAPKCVAGSLPSLYGQLHQLPLKYCNFYTPSFEAGIAVAECEDQLMSGPIDKRMSPLTLDAAPTRRERGTRLSAEGNRLLVPIFDSDLVQYEIAEYELQGNGTWASVGPATPYATILREFSAPSRAPDRRLVFQDYDNGLVLVELSDQSGSWREVTRYPVTEVGAMAKQLNDPNLTPDGLRLVFRSETILPDGHYVAAAIFYAERATLDERFANARVIDVAPHDVLYPYLTEDCGRLYFTALATVFYME